LAPWATGLDHYHTLSQERAWHAAVVIQDTIILVGGDQRSSQDRRRHLTGEIIKSGTSLFDLQNSGWGTCAVAYEGNLVVLGGQGISGLGTHGKVDRYDSQGNYLGSLPDLATARYYHACATFVSSEGEEGLLVAGGKDNNWNPLSSTEVYSPSSGRWTSGGSLPRALYALTAARLNQKVIVVGGTDVGYNGRDKVLEYDGSAWTEKGRIKRGRSGHAVVEANLLAICAAGRDTTQTEQGEIQKLRLAFEQEIAKLETKFADRIAKMFEEQKQFIASHC